MYLISRQNGDIGTLGSCLLREFQSYSAWSASDLEELQWWNDQGGGEKKIAPTANQRDNDWSPIPERGVLSTADPSSPFSCTDQTVQGQAARSEGKETLLQLQVFLLVKKSSEGAAKTCRFSADWWTFLETSAAVAFSRHPHHGNEVLGMVMWQNQSTSKQGQPGQVLPVVHGSGAQWGSVVSSEEFEWRPFVHFFNELTVGVVFDVFGQLWDIPGQPILSWGFDYELSVLPYACRWLLPWLGTFTSKFFRTKKHSSKYGRGCC